jgi:hypothetical protein
MVFGLMAAVLMAVAGCDAKNEPPPLEYAMYSPYPAVRTYAVAPVVNLSGSRDFDSLMVADALFGELTQVRQLQVLAVNKTLATMQRLGIEGIRSAADAQRVANAMGADAIVIAAITAYDPYNPPTIGMTLQLYTARDLGVPPEQMERDLSGQPLPTEGGELRADAGPQPVSQISAIFPATNQTVLVELNDFAKGRSDYESALQDRRYLVDIDYYTRFVCHAMTRRLLETERGRISSR